MSETGITINTTEVRRRKVLVVEFNSKEARERLSNEHLDSEEQAVLIHAYDFDSENSTNVVLVAGSYTDSEINQLIENINKKHPEAQAKKVEK